MGSACAHQQCDSFPLCESSPVARKGRGGSSAVGLDGHVVHLIHSTRVSPALLRTQPVKVAEKDASTASPSPPWLRDHLVLLYNGVAESEDAGGATASRHASRTRSKRSSSSVVAGEEDDESAEVAAMMQMFHGYFQLAEYQRSQRQSQATYAL